MYPNTYEINCTCPICGKINIIIVPWSDYLAWQSGECIQDAMPYLKENEREALLTGLCPSCWDNIFKNEKYNK